VEISKGETPMTQAKSITWGPTQIKYFVGNLGEKDVKNAASLVSPSFENLPKDSFVAVNKDGPIVFSYVPTKPKATEFFARVDPNNGGVPDAIKQALEKAANFLKGRG
jgi:hypothetical protein